MAETFTITEISDTLAGEGATDEDRALLHRQIRIFHKKGFLVPVSVKDARGTAAFDTLALYRVRVLAALVSVGLDSDSGVFRSVHDAMTASSGWGLGFVPPSAGEGLYRGGLADAARGVNQGEQWRLTVIHSQPYLHGFRDYRACFHHIDDQPADTSFTAKQIFSGQFDLNAVFEGLPLVNFGRA